VDAEPWIMQIAKRSHVDARELLQALLTLCERPSQTTQLEKQLCGGLALYALWHDPKTIRASWMRFAEAAQDIERRFHVAMTDTEAFLLARCARCLTRKRLDKLQQGVFPHLAHVTPGRQKIDLDAEDEAPGGGRVSGPDARAAPPSPEHAVAPSPKPSHSHAGPAQAPKKFEKLSKKRGVTIDLSWEDYELRFFQTLVDALKTLTEYPHRLPLAEVAEEATQWCRERPSNSIWSRACSRARDVETVHHFAEHSRGQQSKPRSSKQPAEPHSFREVEEALRQALQRRTHAAAISCADGQVTLCEAATKRPEVVLAAKAGIDELWNARNPVSERTRAHRGASYRTLGNLPVRESLLDLLNPPRSVPAAQLFEELGAKCAHWRAHSSSSRPRSSRSSSTSS